MADEKRIGVSIDTSGYDEGFNRIQRRADELATDMIRNSREMGQSSKDIIKDLEEQIRIIERRNKLASQYKQEQLEVGRLRGDVSQEKFQTGQRQIKIETSEEKMHTSLLKEIADNIKSGDKDRLRESRSSSERLYEGIKSDELKEAGLEEGDAGEPGVNRPTKGKRAGGGVYGVGYTNKIVGAGNIYETGAGVLAEGTRRGMGLAGMGLVGTLSALGVGKAIQAAFPYEKALGESAAISGGSYSNYQGFLRDQGERMGFGMEETLGRRGDIARARMSSKEVASKTLESLQLERLNFDPSLLIGMETLTRSGGQGAMESTQQMYAALKSTGVIKGEGIEAMPEYLQTLVSISQDQLKTLGHVSDGNIQMIAGISNLDESFKNPVVLQQVMGQIYQGLTTAQTPQQEALQMNVLSKIRPGQSLFDYQVMRENPFAKENRQYLPMIMQTLEDMSMGNESLFGSQIRGYFGGSATIAKKMRGGWEKGTLVSDIEAEYGEGKDSLGIKERVEGATPKLLKSMKEFNNFFAVGGEKLISEMTDITTGFIDTVVAIKSYIETMKELNELEKTNYKLAKEKQEILIAEIDANVSPYDAAMARAYLNFGDTTPEQKLVRELAKDAAKQFVEELKKMLPFN